MSCSYIPPDNITDCCSKPDYEQTSRLIRECGFNLPEWVHQDIENGFCYSVTIGPENTDGIPFVNIEYRNNSTMIFLHPEDKQASKKVFDILNPDHEEKKAAQRKEWIKEGENLPKVLPPFGTDMYEY